MIAYNINVLLIRVTNGDMADVINEALCYRAKQLREASQECNTKCYDWIL